MCQAVKNDKAENNPRMMYIFCVSEEASVMKVENSV